MTYLSKIYKKDLYKFKYDIRITNVEEIINFLDTELNIKEEIQEVLYCICLNSKNNIINIFENTIGTSNYNITSSKDIMKKVLLSNADRLILVHNHPSGDSTPSDQDNIFTKQINKACKILDVKLLDHIIVGKKYFSYYENEIL